MHRCLACVAVHQAADVERPGALPPCRRVAVGHGRYARVRTIGLSPLVEPLSIDEAFLDLTGCKGSNGASAAETLVRFARQVEVKVGVAVSVGLSYANFWRNLPRISIGRGFAFIGREGRKHLGYREVAGTFGPAAVQRGLTFRPGPGTK
jgi:hypothetical protein